MSGPVFPLPAPPLVAGPHALDPATLLSLYTEMLNNARHWEQLRNPDRACQYHQAAAYYANASAMLSSAPVPPADSTGITDGSDAPPGHIGEVMSATVSLLAAANISDATNTDLLSLTLSAGDWDVVGTVYFQGTSKGGDLELRAWTNSVAVTQPSGDAGGLAIASTSAGNLINELPIGVQRFNLTAPTQIHLGCYADFTGGTMQAKGFIRARRMR